jgi:hypothetical protein
VPVQQAKRPDVQDELKAQAPTREYTGPYYEPGAVTRLERRVQRGIDPTRLNLAHGLWGRSQMSIVQVRTIPQCRHRTGG